jgi:hypothetical protein
MKGEDKMDKNALVTARIGEHLVVSQLACLIGQEAIVKQGGLGVRIIIKDAKRVYGCTRFLVTAKAGDGSEIWIDCDRVVLA